MNFHHKVKALPHVSLYLVGGAVRDMLLKVEPKDKDYVVVGSSPEEMLSLGFKEVGKDFPVFLNPDNGDEYSLARTERKVGVGYTGFDCNWKGVTLEEDLARRDLTINSMAIDCKDDLGKIIDPFNGRRDIKNNLLRHTTEAFKEDPVRVLRVARFLSRLGSDWAIADETVNLCVRMDNEGSLQHLVPERVFLEMDKALYSNNPSVFFDSLAYTGLYPFVWDMVNTGQRIDHHPEGHVWIHTSMVMDYAAKHYKDNEITFACLTHDFGKPISQEKFGNAHGHEIEGLQPIKDFCDEWKVPNTYRELALLVCEHHTKVHGILGRSGQEMTRPKSIMKLFEQTSALTKPERFSKILKCCVADARGRGGTPNKIKMFEERPYPQAIYLQECLTAVLNTDTKSLTKYLVDSGVDGKAIGERVRVARIDSIRKVQNEYKKRFK